jgi:hypothetical protein
MQVSLKINPGKDFLSLDFELALLSLTAMGLGPTLSSGVVQWLCWAKAQPLQTFFSAITPLTHYPDV